MATFALTGVLLFARCVNAQSGAGYGLTWNTVDGGGATFSTGGAYIFGGTIGQPDASRLSGGAYILNGGFWNPIVPAAILTPTATPANIGTALPTPSATVTLSIASTGTPQHTQTPLPTAVWTATANGAHTVTPTHVSPPSATVTATATPLPTASPVPTRGAACVGDCNDDHAVTVDELVKGVNIALGTLALGECLPFDCNGNGHVTVDCLVKAVNAALNGCGG